MKRILFLFVFFILITFALSKTQETVEEQEDEAVQVMVQPTQEHHIGQSAHPSKNEGPVEETHALQVENSQNTPLFVKTEAKVEKADVTGDAKKEETAVQEKEEMNIEGYDEYPEFEDDDEYYADDLNDEEFYDDDEWEYY